MESTKMIPLNLQFFAEEGGADTSNADPAAQGDSTDLKPADLNTMLAGDKTLQSQFDQLVGKALTTARGKWERTMESTKMIPPNLQFFAEGGGADTSNADPAAQGDSTDLKPADLNTMLAGDKTLQSQFDQLVGKALTTARGKWEREQSMTAEQLMQARTSEQAQALAEREQALAARELRAEAMSLLSQRQLPTELIECVQTSDPATMNQSLQSAEKAFRQAVQQGIESRMAGSAPKGAGNSPSSHLTGFRAAAGIKPKA